jgi:predicted peroxiredoxin
LRKERLAVLLWAAPLGDPDLLRAPFVYAAAAAAMDAEVEMHFSGRTVRLLVADAENQEIKEYMREVAAQGVRFLGCSSALKRHVREGETMIAAYAGAAGAASFSQRALDPEWRTLVF